MRLMTRFVIMASLLIGVSQAAAAQTAEEIVEKYLNAIGGRATLAKLETRHVMGTLSMSTSGGNIAGTAEVFAQAPNRQRTVMTMDLSQARMGKVTIDQRFDGESAYTIDSMQGNREITGNALDNMKNTAFPTPFLTYKERGVAIEYAGKQPAGAGEAHVVVLKPKSGSVVQCFFDAQSYLLVKMVTTVNVPQLGGDVQQTNEFLDYRDQDGIKVPFQMKNTSKIQSYTINVTKVEHNIKLDATMFSKPSRQD